jgi:hypothetical protein
MIGNANQLYCISQYYKSKLELFIREETNGNCYLSRRVLSKLGIKYSIQQDIFIKIVEIIKLISNETKLSKDLVTKVMDTYNNLSFNHSKIPLDIIFNIEKFAAGYNISLQKALSFALVLSRNNRNTEEWKIDLLTHLLPEDIMSIIASHDPILLEVYNGIGQRTKAAEKAEEQKQIENTQRAKQKQVEYEQFAAQSSEAIEANFHAINVEYKKLEAVALVKVIVGACGDEVFNKNDYTNTLIQIPDISNTLFYFNLYRSKTQSLAQEKLNISSQILTNINAQDTQGRTPLIKAAQQGNDIAIKYIFENMSAAQIANIIFNMTDLSGKTALHYLVAKGMQTEAKLLLEKGASPYIEDRESHSAYSQSLTSVAMRKLCALMIQKFGPPPNVNQTEHKDDDVESTFSDLSDLVENFLGLELAGNVEHHGNDF